MGVDEHGNYTREVTPKVVSSAIKELEAALAFQEGKQELPQQLRDAASKGVSAWGSLMEEAANEIEILQAELHSCGLAADRMFAELSGRN
jgi:hypothetical protein